jgi:hypothetical protein
MAAVPPVVDHVQRTKIQDAISTSSFSIFNIIAIVAILLIGYYLYRRFVAKKPVVKFPIVPPTSQKVEPAPIEEEKPSDEVKEE